MPTPSLNWCGLGKAVRNASAFTATGRCRVPAGQRRRRRCRPRDNDSRIVRQIACTVSRPSLNRFPGPWRQLRACDQPLPLSSGRAGVLGLGGGAREMTYGWAFSIRRQKPTESAHRDVWRRGTGSGEDPTHSGFWACNDFSPRRTFCLSSQWAKRVIQPVLDSFTFAVNAKSV